MITKSPMGISIVRTFGGAVTEQNVITAADAMVSRGLVSAGYEYLIVGDGVFAKRRDAETGRFVCDSIKFPHGIKYISDYLHEKGIKLGVLTSAGALTVNSAPGSIDHEFLDAETLSDWGVDYIAHDTTHIPVKAEILPLIKRMGFAIRQSGRDMVYSVYSNMQDLHTRARSFGADVYCTRCFSNAIGVKEPAPVTSGYSGEYCRHNCGEIVVTPDTTLKELRSQLITAASFMSPIIVDCDVTLLSDEMVALLVNKELLAVVGDSEGRCARRMSEGIYCKFLDNAEYAIAFVNNSDEAKTFSFYTYDFGLTWNAELTCSAEPIFDGEKTDFDACMNVKVAARDAALYRMKLI